MNARSDLAIEADGTVLGPVMRSENALMGLSMMVLVLPPGSWPCSGR